MCRFRTVSPDEIRVGQRVRFGARRAVYTVQGFEEHKEGKAYIVCYGPLGAPGVMGGGQAFYVGPKKTMHVDLVTGKRVKLKPQKVMVEVESC